MTEPSGYDLETLWEDVEFILSPPAPALDGAVAWRNNCLPASGAACPVVVVGRRRLVSQGLDR
jgi:hypothetical protein